MNASFLAVLILFAGPAHAQGFAGLGQDATGFALPRAGVPFDFPADHGAHPDYRIEWWYVTTTLTSSDGRDYGAQWTLFRSALAPEDRPGWDSPQVWMGHAALTAPDAHFVAEKLGRGGIGQAGVETEPFEAWIDDWRFTGTSDLADMQLSASGPDFGYDLALQAAGPLVPQGNQGYSVKSAAGQASYYYSQPFYEVSGSIRMDGATVNVTGKAWLDREWSSQPLAADQTGWDWFSLMFDDGARLMGFRLRDAGEGYTSATWIAADGTPSPMPAGALEVTPLREATVAGRDVPVEWRVQLPAKGLDVTVSALNDNAWMTTSFPYWEGPIRIAGSHTGRGYLEMTGY